MHEDAKGLRDVMDGIRTGEAWLLVGIRSLLKASLAFFLTRATMRVAASVLNFGSVRYIGNLRFGETVGMAIGFAEEACRRSVASSDEFS